MAKNPFLNFPPEFYKNLFAASALYTHQQNNKAAAASHTTRQHDTTTNKVFNAQNFPRNLLYSTRGDDAEVVKST